MVSVPLSMGQVINSAEVAAYEQRLKEQEEAVQVKGEKVICYRKQLIRQDIEGRKKGEKRRMRAPVRVKGLKGSEPIALFKVGSKGAISLAARVVIYC